MINAATAETTVENIIELAQPEAKDPNKHDFSFEGRDFSLYKKYPGREGQWYIRVQIEGKRVPKCLETNHAETAEKNAKKHIALLKAGKWQDLEKMKQRRQISTWGDVMKLYLPDPDEKKGWPGLHGVDPRTAKNNAWAMGKILKDVLDLGDVTNVPLSKLDDLLCVAFQDSLVKKKLADADKDKDSQKWARAQAENSSKSIILQARSIFNKGRLMVQQYEKHGLIIPPCIEKFLEAKLNGKDQQRAMYLRPADHVIKKTFEEIEKLRDTDREVYLLFWLACGCGLRRGEALRSRWEYFVTRDGKPWFDGGVGKDGEHIKVPVQDRAWAALEPVKKESGPVIESESLEAVRRVGFWLDMQGWKTEKKMHELRAYIGSLIYQVDHMAAMKFMRHKSIKVTEKFYVRYGGKAIPTNVL